MVVPAITERRTKNRKKSACPPSLNHPYHGSASSPDSIASILPATWPPSLLAIALARYQRPIRRETLFAGDTLVTKPRPVGDMLSSPIVWKKYVAVSQNIEARATGVVPRDPATMKTYPMARK